VAIPLARRSVTPFRRGGGNFWDVMIRRRGAPFVSRGTSKAAVISENVEVTAGIFGFHGILNGTSMKMSGS